MSVTAINMVTTGSVDLLPNLIQIQTNDTLATVTAAGYLNGQLNLQYLVPGGLGAFNNQQLALVYTTDSLTTILSVSVSSSGVITLSSPAESSGVFASVTVGDGTAALPTINFVGDTTTGLYRASSHVIGFAANGSSIGTWSATGLGVMGTISATGTVSASTGNLVSGASAGGYTGELLLYPTTTAKGTLSITATANSGNTATSITNAAMGQASALTIPDPGAAASSFVLNNATANAGTGSGSWGNGSPPTPTKVMTINIGGTLYYCPLVAQNT